MARDIKAITQTQKKLEASMIEYRTVYVEKFQPGLCILQRYFVEKVLYCINS